MNGKKMMDAEWLENLNVRLRCACASLDVIRDAVTESPAADALYSVLDTFQRIQQDFETELEKAANA